VDQKQPHSRGKVHVGHLWQVGADEPADHPQCAGETGQEFQVKRGAEGQGVL